MLSEGPFVRLRLSDLSSVDDRYINSVRGEHTATENGHSEIPAFAIYSLLTPAAQITSFLSLTHLLVHSVKMHIHHAQLSLYLAMEMLQGKLRNG